jgi:hypothetical protein
MLGCVSVSCSLWLLYLHDLLRTLKNRLFHQLSTLISELFRCADLAHLRPYCFYASSSVAGRHLTAAELQGISHVARVKYLQWICVLEP